MKQNGYNFTQNDYQWFEDYPVQRSIDKIRKTVEEEKRKTLLLLWIVLRKIGHPISINPLDWPEQDDEWEIVSEIETDGFGFSVQAILREPAGAVSNPAESPEDVSGTKSV